MRNYIPVKKYWFEMYTRFDKSYYTPALKFPIEKIMIDKSLFDYQNEVSQSDVLYMLMNFDRDAWMPITINKNYYLLDGQHRLELARLMGMLYIDTVIQDTELLEGDSKKIDDEHKKHSKKITRQEAKLKKLGAELKMIERRLGLGEICSYD